MSTLLGALQALGRPQLVKDAEVLVQERNAALRDAWTVRKQNEELRERLHRVVGERNALQRNQ